MDVSQSSAIVKPTLDEEIKLFKAIAWHISKHDLGEHQTNWFRMEPRAHLRRLGPLGVTGNQPAITGYCKMDKREKRSIEEAIILQKIGANQQTTKAFRELKSRSEQSTMEQGTLEETPLEMQPKSQEEMLLKKARIAVGATIRWKRSFVEEADEAQKEGTEEDDARPHQKATYASRMLACTNCGQRQETSWMQLRTRQGYRAVHC